MAAVRVPLLDLGAQYETIREELVPAIESVLASQRFIGGPEVEGLEREVAELCGVGYGVGCSSGTDALLMSLMTLGIGPGDEVVTTPYSFFATASSIWRVGARPVFVDIDPGTFNIDPTRVEAAVTEKTRAVMPVHLFGQCADMDPIVDVARRHGLEVIEDAAQALGAGDRGRPAGSMGRVGCFSFYPSKNLGAVGDAGMVVTDDEALAERLKSCRNHGEWERYHHDTVGGNFRLDAIQAAALRVKLRHLDAWHSARRENARHYEARFEDVEGLGTPAVRDPNECIFNQYVIRVPRAEACREFLAERGIGTAVYYPLSLHQQPCFASLGYGEGDFPESERAAAETIAIPIYPELTAEQLDYVADALIEFVRTTD